MDEYHTLVILQGCKIHLFLYIDILICFQISIARCVTNIMLLEVVERYGYLMDPHGPGS
jgi:hypothetical protein